MIDGQYLDVTAVPTHVEQLARLHRLKTGALISAAVAGGLVGGPTGRADPYRGFSLELGLLFQIVDDILDAGTEDEPSYVLSAGAGPGAGGRADGRAMELLAHVPRGYRRAGRADRPDRQPPRSWLSAPARRGAGRAGTGRDPQPRAGLIMAGRCRSRGTWWTRPAPIDPAPSRSSSRRATCRAGATSCRRRSTWSSTAAPSCAWTSAPRPGGLPTACSSTEPSGWWRWTWGETSFTSACGRSARRLHRAGQRPGAAARAAAVPAALVVDVSFISLRLVLPPAFEVLASPAGWCW